MTNDLIKAADALAEATYEQLLYMSVCNDKGDLERNMRVCLIAYREARSAQDNELTRLRDQVETLREAIEDIATPKVGPDVDWSEEEANAWRAGRWRWAQNRARAALEATK